MSNTSDSPTHCTAIDPNIENRTHWVSHDEIKLHVWEKYANSPSQKPVVVLAHGSAGAGRESFDLQVPGKPSYSLMDYLAGEGFDVFAPDIRGFGRSTRPETHLTTAQAGQDLNAVVDHIRQLRGVEKVNLLAWSWGTQYGGLFAMDHPAKVSRYVSYAQMHVDSPDIALRRTKIDIFRKQVYIRIPEQGWKLRFSSLTPDTANDREVIEAYAKAAASIETQTPTGPQLDMVSIMPMIHARLINIPCMVIHGQYDDVADPEGLFPFFHQLPNPDKRYVIVPQAGHMMHLQKGHRRFQREVSHFFFADAKSD